MEYRYTVSKRMEIAGSHQLSLDYDSKCQNLHGHNWIVTVYCGATTLNRNGMVIDFTQVKKLIHDRLDHQHINNVLDGINPTAENMARWILEELNDYLISSENKSNPAARCYKVTVQESEGNVACCSIDNYHGGAL